MEPVVPLLLMKVANALVVVYCVVGWAKLHHHLHKLLHMVSHLMHTLDLELLPLMALLSLVLFHDVDDVPVVELEVEHQQM